MLSVLIASYNWNVVSLVKELHEQLVKATIPFEIICLDDASKSVLNTENEQINSLTNTSFKVLEKNIGRSAIRNLLAKKATHDWLLFLDADTMPVSKSFIQNYLNEISKNSTKVVLGGIAYKDNEYSDRIRWKLGKKGEEKTSEVRNTNPFQYFFTGNFLVHNAIFEDTKFDEELTQYGYEDLLFAKELEAKNVKVKHINNSVFHLGIDTNSEFLNKTKQALENAVKLLEKGKISFENAKVLALFKKLKSLGITSLLSGFIDSLERKALNNSSLFYYHLFRLAYLHKVFKNRQ